jgi:amino acid adenylation domain-containing protein/thioester reductase-like protein
VDYGEFSAVPHMIEDMADRGPDRVAVCHAGCTLTYRELDQLANGIALTAGGRGLNKGDRVATLLVNSLEMPAAYLAMMKLGAVFVPLDPGWPAERLLTTLRVLSPRLVLCEDPGQVPPEFRQLSMQIGVGTPPSSRRPGIPLSPGDLCYGFFTSGTTGSPKCALNRHVGLANRLRFMTRWFGATGAIGDDVVLQNSKHTFDSSLWQLMWPLSTGGRTVLPRAAEFLDLRRTIDTIAEYQVTTTDFVSSVFNALVAMVDGDKQAQQQLSTLRHLIVGSEEINARAVHRMRVLLPRLAITNGYGPTETTIGMVFHLISDADGDKIPIGKPIGNCHVVLLSDEGTPVSPGAVGEIAIGGACVGAGYLGDQEATDKAFIPNPYPDRIPGDRLYLSGDYGFLDGQGRIFFSGRNDFQVKIGGVRIELGEIEAAAQQCPGVYQAKAVVADRDGMKSIAVFAAGTATLSSSVLRGHLQRVLPRTSVPRYCIALPSMPLSEGGKVDWRELAAMLDRKLAADAAELQADELVAAPRSWLELVLRAFKKTLGQPDLTPDTDFLAAGGDSLRAVAAMRLVTDESGIAGLCALDLLEHPTARTLAELIATHEPGSGGTHDEIAQMDRDATFRGPRVVAAPRSLREPRTVLVTGATGFVGARLVHDLLAGTDLRVRCLARAEGDTAAAERVAEALAERGLWQPRFAGRLEGYAGDLSRPALGLADAVWDHLAVGCDLVLHSGALVNLVFGYAAHRAPNVTGTAELLRLAMARRPVPLHYVSTLAAMHAEAMTRGSPMPEADPSATAIPARGYNRSKWVAERYLVQARRQGATITMLRLGEVMPDEKSIYPNKRALTHLLLQAIHQLGVYPDAAVRSDYTPAGYVGARVVAAVLDQTVWGETLHVFHPDSIDLAEALATTGAAVTRTSCAEFLTRLRAGADRSANAELAGLAALLPDPPGRAEADLRSGLAALLTDNPSLFSKEKCRQLEDRWRLSDGDLRGPIAAYRAHLEAAVPVVAAPQLSVAPQPTGR